MRPKFDVARRPLQAAQTHTISEGRRHFDDRDTVHNPSNSMIGGNNMPHHTVNGATCAARSIRAQDQQILDLSIPLSTKARRGSHLVLEEQAAALDAVGCQRTRASINTAPNTPPNTPSKTPAVSN